MSYSWTIIILVESCCFVTIMVADSHSQEFVKFVIIQLKQLSYYFSNITKSVYSSNLLINFVHQLCCTVQSTFQHFSPQFIGLSLSISSVSSVICLNITPSSDHFYHGNLNFQAEISSLAFVQLIAIKMLQCRMRHFLIQEYQIFDFSLSRFTLAQHNFYRFGLYSDLSYAFMSGYFQKTAAGSLSVSFDC